MDRIQFSVNGQKHSVGSEVTSHMTLLDYLRTELELRGTKYMCREGGCGACIVIAIRSPGAPQIAVNSCLVSITSCQDWEVTTIEAVGNHLKGYSEVQKALASHNGSQCGYCSPAWVMTMESLLKNKKPEELTKLEVEKYFSSNICRCTGYRPILDTFKTFAKKDETNVGDIEDLNICNKDANNCNKLHCTDKEWCFVDEKDFEDGIKKEINLKDDKVWYSVTKVADIFDVFAKHRDESYMLVGGNTGKGVYPIFDYPKILIDISDVEELNSYVLDQNLILGAGNTLVETMDIFGVVGKSDDFKYCLKLKEHLELVAHTAVRNIGTVGGNLMVKHEHQEFPSDLFLLFETVGAMITIANKDDKQTIDLKTFLTMNMSEKVIVNVILPPFGKHYKLVSYKIMPRAQNAKATINAGFLYKFDKSTGKVTKATIVYGSLNSTFIHAEQTEKYLAGKKLNSNETLQGALKILDKELVGEGPTHAMILAKKKIALGLFYKGLLTLFPEGLDARYASGSINFSLTRPVSKGKQVFDKNPSLYPVTEPINKLDSLIQCAGEASYIDDIPKISHEVYAAFVCSTIAKGVIDGIDAKPALDKKGVIAFYTFKDIPGINSYTPLNVTFYSFATEEVLSSGKINYFSEPIGIIVAESEHLADMAAKLVKITYKSTEKPVTDIKEAKEDIGRVFQWIKLPAVEPGLDINKIIKGTNLIGSQYHFHMEKQITVTKPVEDGLQVSSSTQWIDVVEIAIAQALKIPDNSVTLTVRRVGGAFGAKLTRQSRTAVASALVSTKLNRPSRMVLPLTTNMRTGGLRPACIDDFEVGVNDEGEIQYVNCELYTDFGYIVNELLTILGVDSIGGCYKKKRWGFTGFNVITDRAKSTAMRSPGNLEISAMTEHILERISYELSMDPIELRLKNLSSEDTGDSARELIERVKKEAKYEDRKASVAEYNKQNRWKKRGLRLALFTWKTSGFRERQASYNVNVSVYHGDGSVIITHGGIDMGQGLNTKVIQVCAQTLSIPVDKIKVKPSSNVNNPNSYLSGNSTTTEFICYGAIKCCEQLLERLDPLKLTLGEVTWEVLVAKAYATQMHLCTSYNVRPTDLKRYDIYGTAIAEVEIDVLTGEFQVLRVDLVEDVGQTINPNIDVGQIEGSFIMSMGYWTCEEIIYNQKTGEMLTDRTWNYHVPQARDIPQDLRIYFRRHEYNKKGVLGSKASGEPATCLGICVPFAIREAIAASRLDSGVHTTEWFDIVGSEVTSHMTLLDYLRTELELRGTKYMCREGGCGACIVIAIRSPGAPQIAVNSTPAAKEFKFTEWWAMPGRQNNRKFHQDVIQKILSFYEAFPWDMDMSAALGLFLLKINLDNTYDFMQFTQERYRITGNKYTCIVDSDFKDVQGLSNRTEQLIEKFMSYMLARVPRLNTIRRVASGFLFNEDNWMFNLKPFALDVRTLYYSRRLANSWTVPTVSEYEKAIYNWSFISPTIPRTEKCLVQLTDNVVFHHLYPQLCNWDIECLDAIVNGDDYGYSLSHRIFLLVYAKFARNCYAQSVGEDQNLVMKLCSIARLECDYLAEVLNYDVPDLLMEYLAYCTLAGHREIMLQEWYVKMIELYASAPSNKLCYVRHNFKKKRPALGNYKSTVWEIVRGTINPMGPCDRHLTGLALAAHAAAFRACAEPIYCADQGGGEGICCIPFELSAVSKAYSLGTIPRKFYPMKYLIGFTKGTDPTSDTNNMFTSMEPPENNVIYVWSLVPVLSMFRDEPNSYDYKYDQSDDGFGIRI